MEKIVVCGYSNGGSIAQEFALTYPDRVLGVILMGGSQKLIHFYLEMNFD
ncbi:alpha/beta hydrolase [Anaerobacillus sp. HL2]|nr:alpha/beta hydrolase [Anaerobacillus sp. HL2]